jgi:hypothetical protein
LGREERAGERRETAVVNAARRGRFDEMLLRVDSPMRAS